MKFFIPKLNIYNTLSRFQENLWNTIIPRLYTEQWADDNFRFCYNAHGMTSDRIHMFDHNIQKAVSSFPYGTTAAAIAGLALDTTVTVGQINYDQNQIGTSTFETAWLYGYKRSGDSHPIVTSGTSSGSMASNTYVDGGSTTRTIVAIGWSDNGISGTPIGETDNIYFGLNGTGISDSDTTFVQFTYNGTTYTRTSRSSYTNPASLESFWQWDNVATNGPTSGTVSFTLET